MKSLIVLLGLVAGSFALDACSCNRMLLPVCGSDGVTYSNPCLLNCERVKNKHDLQIVSYGQCHNTVIAKNEDMCICTREYMPVCASNGKTYGNPCEMKCAQKNNPSLQMVNYGECNEINAVSDDDAICACPMIYWPVCGSNGKTYPNRCQLECAQTNHPSLTLVHDGVCKQVEIEAVSNDDFCACTMEYMPVCASNGVTYGNLCGMKCAQKKNPSLTLVNNGECKRAEIEAVSTDDLCICTREYMPVCASNGKTYGNLCLMKCAMKKDPSLTVVDFDECESSHIQAVSNNHPCICTREYNPVCGSDGETYSNPCVMRCSQANKPGLTMAHYGSCNEISFQAKPSCACNKLYRPVCASNGVTYNNPCMFSCAKKQNSGLKIVKQGPCAAIMAEKVESDSCVCSKEWNPVCGTDMKTYDNVCLLRCAADKKPGLKMLYPMICVILP